ncbi:MAG: hypothetical protein JNJ54_33020 [Myxococcaceae bacterium]|nr:hypothetical protein [Myxococcaceae bacterium]
MAVSSSRAPSVAFVVVCFIVAVFVLVDDDVGVWAQRLIAPVTIALIHFGAVQAGRGWAVAAAILVTLLGVGAAALASTLVLVVSFTGKKDLVNVPLIAAGYCLVVAVHAIVMATRPRSSPDGGA